MTTLPITLVGGTGLTGSATLLALLQSPSAINLTAITRRDHPSPVQNYTNASTSYINRALPNLADAITSTEGVGPKGGVYISCLGTTRGQAGGFEKQKEIDLYLNRDLVTKAKADGAKTVSQLLPHTWHVLMTGDPCIFRRSQPELYDGVSADQRRARRRLQKA
jgi:hypothetical protein